MKIKKLDERISFYKSEISKGYSGYHNPYDVEEELYDLLTSAYYKEIADQDDDHNEYEDKILEIVDEYMGW